MWLKMRSVKVCFEFLASVHILDHSIYVSNLPSGITKATPLQDCNWQKTTCWIMITAASMVVLPQDSCLRTPQIFIGSTNFQKFTKITKLKLSNIQGHLISVSYHCQLQVLNKCDNCKKIIQTHNSD